MRWIAFDPHTALGTLARHRVDFVLIGGFAAALHGSPLVTNDADIVPNRDPANLARLAAALRELDAKVYTEASPEGVKFDVSVTFLANVDLLNLVTMAGRLDLTFTPAGTSGFGELIDHAVVSHQGEYDVWVASLDDIIRSKRAANRAKDVAALPILEALRDEIDNA